MLTGGLVDGIMGLFGGSNKAEQKQYQHEKEMMALQNKYNTQAAAQSMEYAKTMNQINFEQQNQQPAKIQFAHGFFNSALHEISHWSISGEKRRLLPDLGYWYAPDGRTAEQQALFEQVEIKPQAIEWLFATAFGRKFRVSLDNLTGDSGNGTQFKDNVFAQVQRYFSGEATLPRDAALFIHYICVCTRNGLPLQLNEFKRELLD